MSIKFLNLDKTLPVEKIRSTRPVGYKFPVGLSVVAVSGSANAATNTTGGTQTIDGTDVVHAFTSTGSDTFTPSFDGTIELLMVGGGGSGGAAGGGGGGAGGLIYNSAYPVTNASPITVVVGGGGSGIPGPRSLPSPPSQGSSGSNTTLNNQIIIAKQEQSKNTYPFSIQLSGSNEIEFKVSSNSSLNATLATTSSVDEWTHVVCQKSGSELQIWLDAGLHVSSSHDFLLNNVNSLYTASGRIDNNVPLNIGGFSPNTLNLTGDLDEIRIFNKSLTESEISALSGRTENGTFLQTNHVGNVFGKHGTIVISSPHYKYENLTTTSYTASYRSTLTIQEHSTLVNVAAGDFNLSLNPSLEQETGEEFKLFTTGSDFTPYITTIGLYNDQGQLLVIGKLAQPIRKRNDVDMNFLIRFDTDI